MTQSVLITGAGSGIGLATAIYLAQQGFRVYATAPDRDQFEAIEAAAQTHQVRLDSLVLDVTKPETIQACVAQIVAEAGSIDAVVNCAGLGLRGFFEDLSEAEIRRVFDVNVFGVMAVTRAVLPYMRAAQRGHIVIVTSAGGRVASMTISGYCAGKFALEGFGEALSLEMAPLNVNVSLIEPGLVMTPHFTAHRGRAAASLDPSSPYHAWFMQHEQMVDRMLQTNRITPADVAKAIHKALRARRPRLRYVVGWRAALLIALRRFLPERLFLPIYANQLKRIVTKPSQPAQTLQELSLPGATSLDYLGFDSHTGTSDPHVQR